MYILVVGLNHRTAPLEIRERLAFGGSKLSHALEKLRRDPAIEGCVILSTCNRTEIYAASRDPEASLETLYTLMAESSSFSLSEARPYFYTYNCNEAVTHLFRVACGLDSIILGEAQILGQVREAYQAACAAGATNAVLNTLFQQAITVGKRVRTETYIDHHTISISYAAIELARQVLGDLADKKVLVIGAGKMSALAIKYLVDKGVNGVLVTNRSEEKAEQLARECHGQVIHFEELLNNLFLADIVISGTAAPHLILRAAEVEQVTARREGRPMVFIDIAVPRDIDPEVAHLPGVSLYDIDDLEGVVQESLEARQQAAVAAEEIIKEEVDSFLKWLSSLSVVPTIIAMKTRANNIKEAELQKAFNKLAPLSPREKKIISSMASSIVNQLLHAPVVNLKKYAAGRQGHQYAEILQELFELEVAPAEEAEKVEAGWGARDRSGYTR